MDPAPLDHEAVAGTLAPFGHSSGLPAAAYHSPEVFSWEHDRLFNGTWFCVGRVDDLVQPGQVRGIQVGNETAVMARDGKTVRAFSNVCRHRGHELVPVGEARDTR
ncbi:MAG: Rieske 2Fe-2S domain-containing protein, partial [Acidobacteria bacterium]|nr:Rieske 2Fe-2S domain-containing protein [Acidobacteriota bacterium]